MATCFLDWNLNKIFIKIDQNPSLYYNIDIHIFSAFNIIIFLLYIII